AMVLALTPFVTRGDTEAPTARAGGALRGRRRTGDDFSRPPRSVPMTSHTVKGGQNMSTVVVDISMSLDGYITGPSPNLEQGLGRGGEAIHGWVMASDPAPEETALVDRGFRATGAVVMGRRSVPMTSHTVKGGQNMSTVVVDISMSLDGYITGPSPNLEQGLGRGGEAIHGWVMASDPAPEETALVDRGFRATGAVVMGRRT